MPRPFLEIMREIYIARRSGLSAAVSMMSVIGQDDAEWELIVNRLFADASLMKSLKRLRPNQRKKT